MLIELIEKYAESTPDAPALVHAFSILTDEKKPSFKTQQLTYKELNEGANQFAHYLKSSGFKKNDRIAVCLDNSSKAVIVFLAIGKLGAIYLPLHPDYPEERLMYILEDSKASCVITNSKICEQLSKNEDIHAIDVNADISPRKYSNENLKTEISEKDDAYIIYTSGTTGKPKGVTIQHKGLTNWLVEQKRIFKLTADDRVLQFAPISFDSNIWDILMGFREGGSVYTTTSEVYKDADLLNVLFEQLGITAVTVTPTVLSWLHPNKNWKLRMVLSTGEAFKPEYAERFFKLFIKIYNCFGPTEVCFGSHVYLVTPEDVNKGVIPIGKPINGIQVYLLDEKLKQVSEGEEGEIWVSGVGVSCSGYINQKELTKERFIDNWFNENNDPYHNILYKTGDIGRILNDGNMICLGRNDRQIKIEGKRVELGEIETCILKTFNGAVKQIYVTAIESESGQQKKLIAYIVPFEGEKIENWRDSLLKTSLPKYMIPIAFIEIKTLPLTLNGKINEKALPKPDLKSQIAYQSPNNHIEEKLQKIWAELLDMNFAEISMNVNFFAMGGDSMGMQRLKAKLKNEFKVNSSFTASLKEEKLTIEWLAGAIDSYVSDLMAKRMISYHTNCDFNFNFFAIENKEVTINNSKRNFDTLDILEFLKSLERISDDDDDDDNEIEEVDSSLLYKRMLSGVTN